MVNAVGHSTPRRPDGGIDVAAWQSRLAAEVDADVAVVSRSLEFLSTLGERTSEFLEEGIELANRVVLLNMDTVSVAAALLYRPVRTGLVSVETLEREVDPEVGQLVGAVVRLADTSLLELSTSRMQTSESRDQIENIRRMLISMVDDARVAVLKLAERVVALRAAKNASPERQARIAQEAHQIFAPLASRLGVWQLKWELEDLALRYLAPEVYQTIARQLDGRRSEREQEVNGIAEAVQARLRERNIEATVYGRAKHIYSIWRKMRVKNVGLDQVHDVRAIRVLVPDIAQCYAALGVVHTQWQHIPSEFDDYIAVPKENGYRSIHTAVSWDDGKTLEIQIRTPEMHEEAELGVCAHWAYKEGVSEDEIYAQKMEWMRQVVEWQKETEERLRQQQIGLELSQKMEEERIFVYTPKGHVLDLTSGATALDFAYRVHTEVGHRCVAARVDGRTIPLNEPLASGQRVEIITGEALRPQRVWLHQHLGCLHTARAREKVTEWFRERSSSESAEEGRKLLHRSMKRLGLDLPVSQEMQAAALAQGYQHADELLTGLGKGDVQILDLVSQLLPPVSRHAASADVGAQMSLLNEPEQNIGRQPSYVIEVIAEDRPGLLLDVSSFLNSRGIMLLSNSGRVLPDGKTARIEVEVRSRDMVSLLALMDALEMIPGVVETRRVPEP